ncbi:MAG: thiol:disulfide interchange protein [Deltaproteobacteria bacterium]|nr:MAG: thiol:disulfide interchange protein [Deltaproteobacteria bacterium]
MSRILVLLLAGLLLPLGSLVASPVPEGARGVGAVDDGDPRVEARLLFDHSVATAGGKLRAGVYFELDRGWHIYWRNPGESGLPTQLDWQVEAAQVGPVQLPGPEVFTEGGLTTYGYSGEVLLASDVTFDEGARGMQAVRVTAKFLVCRVRCIPGQVQLARTISIGADARLADDRTRALFDRYAARVPVAPSSFDLALDAIYSQSAVRPGDSFRAAIVVVPCAGANRERCPQYALGKANPAEAFVPDQIDSVQIRVTGARPHPFSPGGFLINLEGTAEELDPGQRVRLRGVLAVRVPELGVRWVEVDLDLPTAQAGAQVVATENPWLEPLASSALGVTLFRAILLALLGGVILNLMPCVLPVLAIKVFGVTELAHQNRSEVLRHGFAYTAGILATMLVLAGVVVALRAAGTAVGWGFQFQEPLFVGAISIVLLLFALNLFGVFEIGFDATRLGRVGEEATGPARSFFEGLLAAVLATPCSAPFLGTAVGFAFASSTPVILGIFLAIGLGLAAPYLLVTWFPTWARLIPRPGAWMIQLRRGLGFALLATLVWLVWLTGRTVGPDGVAALLALLLGIAFVSWIYGALQSSGRRSTARVVGLGVVVLAVGGLVASPAPAPIETEVSESGTLEWRVFGPGAVQAELARGRPVFVEFTADWCLTCKANERFVIGDARVQAELERLDVVIFRADWTRRDETIRSELARFGRAGVPMYLLYSPRDPDRPQILPELLTVDLTLNALRGLEARANPV